MADLARAPSPAQPIDSPTRDHRQKTASVVESGGVMRHPLAFLDPHPRELWSLPAGLRELEWLDLHSSNTTSEIFSNSGLSRRDEEFTAVRNGASVLCMEPSRSVEGRPHSTGSDLYSVGLMLDALLTNDHRFLNARLCRMPHGTRSLRRPEVHTEQRRKECGRSVMESSDARVVLKRKSCMDGLVSKGNNSHPDNDFVIDSLGEPSLGLNGSTETPNHRLEGLVYSGGLSHPAAADESGTTPLTKTPEPAWLVASSAANHMTGDASQLTDCMPAPADLAVQVPNMGSRRVHSIGSLRTTTMSLQNVYYVPGLDKNLVSSGQLTKLGYTITLGPSECRVTKNDHGRTLVGKAHFTDDYLFELDFLRVPSSTD